MDLTASNGGGQQTRDFVSLLLSWDIRNLQMVQKEL